MGSLSDVMMCLPCLAYVAPPGPQVVETLVFEGKTCDRLALKDLVASFPDALRPLLERPPVACNYEIETVTQGGKPTPTIRSLTSQFERTQASLKQHLGLKGITDKHYILIEKLAPTVPPPQPVQSVVPQSTHQGTSQPPASASTPISTPISQPPPVPPRLELQQQPKPSTPQASPLTARHPPPSSK